AQHAAKLGLHRGVVEARRPVSERARMAPILVERGQNFVERDIDECLWTSANLFVGAVADDPVDPGSEGRVTPERIDLPHHAPERILDGLLGILLVTRDPYRPCAVVSVRRLLSIGKLRAQTIHHLGFANRAEALGL